jgi:ribosomal protein S18 acetylase RimI-like enzyme
MAARPDESRSVAPRAARVEEFDALAECLADTFETDPVLRFIIPEAAARRIRAPRFYRIVLEQFATTGRIFTTPQRDGVAIWQAPHPPQPSVARQFIYGVRTLAILRRYTLRAHELLRELEEVHHKQPHWYLALLGAHPRSQGLGIGSSLMRHVLRRCDRDGSPAYLESSKESNISFYQRHGFEVVGEVVVPNGPTVWPMLRNPGSARRG